MTKFSIKEMKIAARVLAHEAAMVRCCEATWHDWENGRCYKPDIDAAILEASYQYDGAYWLSDEIDADTAGQSLALCEEILHSFGGFRHMDVIAPVDDPIDHVLVTKVTRDAIVGIDLLSYDREITHPTDYRLVFSDPDEVTVKTFYKFRKVRAQEYKDNLKEAIKTAYNIGYDVDDAFDEMEVGLDDNEYLHFLLENAPEEEEEYEDTGFSTDGRGTLMHFAIGA